jgi:two-component system phosphate regulon sensor histidine kinase PhoR
MLLVRAQEGTAQTLLTEVGLIPLLREAAQRVARIAAGRQVEIRLDRVPDLVAYAHARLLARVFDNLLLNAVQFNRDGGSVVVTAEFEEPASADGWTTGHVVVRVRDTGHGIPADQAHRVFDRFYRVDASRSRRTGGTGLGLAICREVVQLFGGTIRIAASSPEGTEVEVCLPGRCASAVRVDEVVTAGHGASSHLQIASTR